MMTATASHYETLGIGRDAPAEDVRAAYTRLVKAVHPDHGGSAALFRSVREAYEELSDPARRTAYDASLAAGTGAGAPCTGPPQNEAAGPSRSASAQGKGPCPVPGNAPGPAYQHSRTYGGQTGTSARATAPPPAVVRRPAFYRAHPATTLCLLGAAACVVGWCLLSSEGPAAGAQLMGEKVLIGGGVALALGITAALGWAMISSSAARQAQTGPAVVDEVPHEQVVDLLAQLFEAYGYEVWLTDEPHQSRATFFLRRDNDLDVAVLRRSSAPLGPEAVAEVLATMRSYDARGGLLVAPSGLLEMAGALAMRWGVEFWGTDELVARLQCVGFNVVAARALPQRRYGLRLLCSELGHGALVVLLGALFMVILLVGALGAVAPSGSRRR